MASNYTENYGLCQWEATDQVLRTEFNKDNAKVDEVLKETADVAQAAQVLAQAAYSPENSPFVVGSYTGDGMTKRKIELGFTPKAVLVFPSDAQVYMKSNSTSLYGGLALESKNTSLDSSGQTTWVTGRTAIAVTEAGFYVGEHSGGDPVSHVHTNRNSVVFYYLAVR